MISRLMLLALLSAGFLPAQFNLFLFETGKDGTMTEVRDPQSAIQLWHQGGWRRRYR